MDCYVASLLCANASRLSQEMTTAGWINVEAHSLRRDLPWRGRRIDEVLGELLVAGLGVLH
jgi:hypothetical protein